MPRRPLSPAAPALVALFSSGSLAPYLMPTLVGRLGADFGLTPTQAGGIGSAMLLASAGAGLGLASRVAAVGAARLDARGRWAVLVGSASSLGVACGPVTGTLLSVHAGFAATGWTLGAVLLLVAPPLAPVAQRSDRARRPLPVPAGTEVTSSCHPALPTDRTGTFRAPWIFSGVRGAGGGWDGRGRGRAAHASGRSVGSDERPG